MLTGEELEAALLRLVASLDKAAVGALARSGLLAADDLAALILHQILAGQSTLGVVGRSVENLGLRANRHHVTTTDHSWFLCVRSSVVHLSNEITDFFLRQPRVDRLFAARELPYAPTSPRSGPPPGVDLTRGCAQVLALRGSENISDLL